MLPMRTDEWTTSKDRATQLLICEALSFAIKFITQPGDGQSIRATHLLTTWRHVATSIKMAFILLMLQFLEPLWGLQLFRWEPLWGLQLFRWEPLWGLQLQRFRWGLMKHYSSRPTRKIGPVHIYMVSPHLALSPQSWWPGERLFWDQAVSAENLINNALTTQLHLIQPAFNFIRCNGTLFDQNVKC